MKTKLTPAELKWILYDVGNSAFILLVSTIIPIYFNHLSTSAGASENEYLSAWSYAASIATLIVAVLGPIMGTLADFKGQKKKIFMGNALAGAILLACFWIPSNWMLFLALFVVCRVAYSISLVVYDSMLVDVAPEEDMDEVSSKGYAWGYLGSTVPFIISLVVILFYDKIGISFQMAMIICFGLCAVWWIAFTLPLAGSYHQKYYVKKTGSVIGGTFRRLGNTFKNIYQEKKIFWFMVAFFFYIDGVYTIIEMATAYGTSLGLDQNGLLMALLMTQIVAFPASIIFGILAKKYSAQALIKVAIAAYFCIAIYALFLVNLTQFWILAVAVGMFQGGIQALSRSYFAKIIPENASGEYFGLYDIFSKGASFLGTMVVGLVTQITGQQNLAVGCLAFLFLIGFFVFAKAVKIPSNKEQAARISE